MSTKKHIGFLIIFKPSELYDILIIAILVETVFSFVTHQTIRLFAVFLRLTFILLCLINRFYTKKTCGMIAGSFVLRYIRNIIKG